MIDKIVHDISRTFAAPATSIAKGRPTLTGKLVKVVIISDQILSGGNAIFDVNLNGASIFGDPDDRPQILSGQTIGVVSGLTVDVDENTDSLTVDFDGFTGTASAVGGNLLVRLDIDDESDTDAAFNEKVDDRVAALLQEGTNITLTYDDTAGELTIDADTGGGGGGGGSDLGCLLILNDAQTLSNNTETQVFFVDGTVVRDDGGFYNATEDTIEIPTGKAGWYVVSGNVRFQGSTSGNRMLTITADLVDDFIAKTRQGPLTIDDPQELNCTGIVYLAENTILRLLAKQDSGGDVDLQSPSGETQFSIVPAGKG